MKRCSPSCTCCSKGLTTHSEEPEGAALAEACPWGLLLGRALVEAESRVVAVAEGVAVLLPTVFASHGEDVVTKVPVAPHVEVNVEASKDCVPAPDKPVFALALLVMPGASQ